MATKHKKITYIHKHLLCNLLSMRSDSNHFHSRNNHRHFYKDLVDIGLVLICKKKNNKLSNRENKLILFSTFYTDFFLIFVKPNFVVYVKFTFTITQFLKTFLL